MQLYQKITAKVAMLFLLVFAVSCSDDDEVVQEDQLVGTWSLESQEIQNIEVTIVALGTPITVPIDDNALDEFLDDEQRALLDTIAILPEDVLLTFEEDRTYAGNSASAGGSTLTGTWSLSDNGEQLTLTGLEQAQQLLGTSSLTFEVENFTATTISLIASVSDISLDQFDIDEIESVSGEYRLDLRKQ